MVSECPRGLEVGRHIGQLPFDALEVADRLAELFALLGVLDRRVECAPRDDVRHDRGPEPLPVQGLQLPSERRLAPGQDVLLRDDDVHREVRLGVARHVRVVVLDLNAVGVEVDQYRAHALGELRPDDGRARLRDVPDSGLLA